MRGFGAEVYGHCSVGGRTHFGAEHEVELAHFRPVLCSGDGIHDLFIDYDLAKFVEVAVVHRFGEAFVQRVAFSFVLANTRICFAEKSFVERLAEAFACLFNLFFNLIVDFCYRVFDQYIGTIAFLGILVVDQGVVERVHVT